MEAVMEDLSRFCCLNDRCLAFGARGAGNLSVCGYINKAKGIRLLYCCTCKKRFTERKGTVFYRSHMPEEKVLSILAHVVSNHSYPATDRHFKCHHFEKASLVRLIGSSPSGAGPWRIGSRW